MTWTEFQKRWNLFTEGVVRDFTNELIKTCPVDTGFLKNSIGFKKTGKGYTVNMAHYALFVEFGTPPHIITPKNKKTLHWTEGKGGGGKQHFALRVKHPGTRPQPFIRNALQTKLPMIISKNLKTQYA